MGLHILPPHDQARCLAIAAALERASDHPLASAFATINTAGLQVAEPREVAGSGVEGRVDGQLWRIGRHDFVAELHHALASDAPPPDADERLWLGTADGMAASFEPRSALRSGAVTAVAALRAGGLALVIASGDHQRAVNYVARTLGIREAHGRLAPEAKLALLHRLQQQGRRVLMIGDGINDGPVLAAAHVSCAMGRGAALAQSAADLLLMNESLQSIAEAVQTARDNGALVRANLRWALLYNLCAVPLAAIGWVPPWLAAVGMSASSLYVVWRAQRFSREALPRVKP
jgi:Cu2+-exporting ATPase